jgi:glucose-6-phosphate 1-dehydrogenase
MDTADTHDSPDAPAAPNTPASTLVILGASGDLTRRLLFPAIHRLMALGRLATDTKVVGYAMEEWSTQEFVQRLKEGVDEFGDGVDDAVWDSFAANAEYISGDLTPEKLSALTKVVSGPAVFYLALPPTVFAPAAAALGELGLADEAQGFRRLVIEKPFGTSLESARALQASLRQHWAESQLYRIDHFLGKDTVQNILVFRLANRFVEAIWNASSIAQVQITASETLGLEGRWRYYDEAGALRDMLQNHLMQLFAICAMEPPSVWDGEVARQHRAEVLRSVRRISPEDVATAAVRGQYMPGTIAGEPVAGYLEEEHIPSSSTTETYAAIRLFVDNWRWQGVPFTLRSGKRLAGNLTEIALEFRAPPRAVFGRPRETAEENSWIVLRIRPDETIEIDAIAKKAGLGLETERVVLSATDAAANLGGYSAYEQLILDALTGDPSLFIRGDEAEEAWRIVQPVLDAWAASGAPAPYASGSDGPPPPEGFFLLPRGEMPKSWRPLPVEPARERTPG